MELPDILDWPERTRDWWGAWVESPITKDWDQLTWEYLLDTALLHATVWGSGDMSKLGELRARVERLGGVPEKTKGVSGSGVKPEASAPGPKSEPTVLDELAARRKNRAAGA